MSRDLVNIIVMRGLLFWVGQQLSRDLVCRVSLGGAGLLAPLAMASKSKS